MRVIIAGDTVYKVSEKEFKKLRSMANAMREADYPKSDHLSDDLNDYLDAAKSTYVEIGPVMFDHRR